MQLECAPRSCPLCGAEESRVFAEANIDLEQLNQSSFSSRKFPEYMHSRMVECSRCGLLYANPALRPEILSDAYKDAAFDSQRESQFAASTYRGFLERYLPKDSRHSALDIGAGDGAFLEQLLKLGFHQVLGIEPSDAPISAAKAEIRKHIRSGIFRTGDFGKESFDLITCFQVMEHVPNPVEIVTETFTLLRPGGMFFIIVHNCRSLSARILGTKSPIFDIEHLQLFSKRTCFSLFERAGFDRITVAPLWNRYPLQYWIKLFPLPRSLKGTLISFGATSRFGEAVIPLPAGNLAVVGYKPLTCRQPER